MALWALGEVVANAGHQVVRDCVASETVDRSGAAHYPQPTFARVSLIDHRSDRPNRPSSTPS